MKCKSILFDVATELIKDISDKYTVSIVTSGIILVQENRIKRSMIVKYFKVSVISE